jgi:2-polyprenyl-6-methoxyphenol hydroxylase-like FAD-dependent oxidoreductase
MAVEDAVVLGEELARGATVPATLEAFMQRRYERARAIGEASIQLGEWEQRPTPDADPDGLLKKIFMLFQQPV